MLACPQCKCVIPEALHNAADFAPCPVCARPIKAEVFPACYAPPEAGRAGETLVVDGDSSCFYHPAKKAETVCETCGRFLCALCDVELNGAHICPSCLQSGKRKGKLKQLENRRTLWDSVALTLAVAPMLFFYFTVLTAPGVIYVVIRYWKSPTSVVGRGKWRYVVAFIIALLQIAGWAFLIYFIQRQMHLAAIHKVH